MRQLPSQVTRNSFWIGATLLVLLYGGIFGYQTIKGHEAREQLLEFRKEISTVDVQGEIERRLQFDRFRLLRLQKVNDDLWIVVTPIQFGAAGSWNLYLEFDRTLVALRVRTADSSEITPSNAPPDIERP